MNRFAKAIINHSTYADAQLLTLLSFIIESLTGNANFASPTPSLASLQTLLTNFTTAVTDAATRDRNKIAQKNTLRQQVLNDLRTLGQYVNTTAEGDYEKLVSSGFKISKAPAPRHLGALANYDVLRGKTAGSVISKLKADAAVILYTHMATPMPVTANSEWITVNSTRSKYVFNNLQPGVEYCFKVMVVATNNQTGSTAELVRLVA